MIVLFFLTTSLAILLQILVVYYSFKLTIFLKPLKYWTKAWGVFTIGMTLIALRRIFSFVNFVVLCPSDIFWHEIESVILLFINICLLYFVLKLKGLYTKYLNGELK